MRVDCEYVAQFYPVVGASVHLAAEQPEPGFSGAGVFRLIGDSGEFCLRSWPQKGLPQARLSGLHQLLKGVFDRGIHQVCVPIVDRGGASLFSSEKRYWQLEPWMPGTSDFHEHSTDARLVSAMECLAAWHKAARSFAAAANSEYEIRNNCHRKKHWIARKWFAESNSCSEACLERAALLRIWLDGQLRQALNAAGNDTDREFGVLSRQIINLVQHVGPQTLLDLDAAGQLQVQLQPCLRDIWHDHVLFTGDRVTGLIDASACRSENVATDLARLLGSLLEDDFDRWRLAIEAYALNRPLSSTDRQLIGVLDRSATVLSGLTWIHRRYLEPRKNTRTVWGRVFQRLQVIARRLQFLANNPSLDRYVFD